MTDDARNAVGLTGLLEERGKTPRDLAVYRIFSVAIEAAIGLVGAEDEEAVTDLAVLLLEEAKQAAARGRHSVAAEADR